MNVLDLFSGIGGFSLGLERAGMRTVAFCEIDPFCRAILKKHWPEVPCFPDIRLLTGESLAANGIFPDIICGGFPCQPFSSASRGRRIGKNDHRNLWPEMCRVISECRPNWVIGENVTNFDRLAIREMVADLEGIGYEIAPPFEIPACSVGHDHRRSRLWIIGYSNGEGQPNRAINGKMAWMPRIETESGGSRDPHGISNRMDRVRAIGNAVVPQIPEIIGRAIMEIENVHAK